MYGLDPDNKGKVVWQFKAGKGSALGGIEWGSAADDQNAYIPVSDVLAPPAEAGGLFALKLATGEKVWTRRRRSSSATRGRGCTGAQSAPVSVIPGVVFSGSVDGHLRAYSTKDGSIIWDYNTANEFETVNRVPAQRRIDRRGRPGDRRRPRCSRTPATRSGGDCRQRVAGVFGEVSEEESMSKPKVLIYARREEPRETLDLLEQAGYELAFGDPAWQ